MNSKNRRRLKRIKEATKSVDALPLINTILNVKDKDIEKLKDDIENSFESNGKLMVERAFLEKVLTPFEYADISTKYEFDDKDFGTILMAYFNKNDKDNTKVMTMAYTKIYKAKEFIKKRFGIKVISTNEFILETRKKDPELFEKYMKENKMTEEDFNKMIEKGEMI